MERKYADFTENIPFLSGIQIIMSFKGDWDIGILRMLLTSSDDTRLMMPSNFHSLDSGSTS